MFLISIIIFPFISGYLFNKYKDSVLDINGIVKLIWIIWLFIPFTMLYFDIIDGDSIYFFVISLWYIIVFFFFYCKSASLQSKNLDKFNYENSSFAEWLIKVFFLIFVIILYINMLDNYSITRNLEIFRYNSKSLLSFTLTFSFIFLLFWTLLEFIDMLKWRFFKLTINKSNSNEKLKQELKAEILAELNVVK